MKRDMQLIRKILEYLEGKCQGDGQLIPVPSLDGYANDAVSYHVGLCIQAGYIEGKDQSFVGAAPMYDMICLTWDGHEKLAELRKA